MRSIPIITNNERNKDMFEEVKAILAKQLRCDEAKITLDSSIKADLGADSLDILQLLMTLEEEKGIAIPDEALAGFEKLSDIVNYLEAAK